MYNVLDYGAISDKKTNNTAAIQKAINECRNNGGGKVFIPSGHYLSSSLELFDNITLEFSSGAVLEFIANQELYPVIESRWEGVCCETYRPCIYAKNAKNIKIIGSGTLIGNGEYWWDIFKKEKHKYPRPRFLGFDDCERITIKDIELNQSPSWTIHPLRSQNITIDNVSIINTKDAPNTDGINPESCQNVRISNCNINVGDDCIAIKSGTEGAEALIPCENITITNCVMENGHGAVVIGSEMSGDVRYVTISNCVFQGTDRGIRLKSRRGRGGTVEYITVNNIVMNEVICPFIMNLYYFCGPGGKDPIVSNKICRPFTFKTPSFKNIYFSNITATNVHAAAGFFYGLPESYLDTVQLTDVVVEMKENATPGFPAMMDGIDEMSGAGIFCHNAKNIQFRNVDVRKAKGHKFDIGEESNVHFFE